MKLHTLLGGTMLTVTALSVAAPANAARDNSMVFDTDITSGIQTVVDQDGAFEIARQGRGRGRGRGGDDNHDGGNSGSGNSGGGNTGGGNNGGGGNGAGGGENGGNSSGSGRSKPRIPGGSGCDDPGDVLEHAECRG